jgi:glucokinase
MKKYSIGIDLGGTRIKIGLVADGAVQLEKIIPADAANNLQSNLGNLKKEIDLLLNEPGSKGASFSGIGLAFPGIVDPVNKKILSTNDKYDDAIGMDVKGWVKDSWDVPFFLDNDARMAAVGEWKYGAGQDTDNLVVMTIGTGIGTAAIIEGNLLRGRHFQAGCLGGHFSIRYDGRLCNCGNIGCVEAYGSSWSLKERLASIAQGPDDPQAMPEVHDFAGLFDAAKKKDPVALRIRQDYLNVWAAGVINLIHAYDPEVVVLGGGVLNNQSDIIPFITEQVKRHAWCPWGDVQVRPSRLLSEAGILGVVHCLENGL